MSQDKKTDASSRPDRIVWALLILLGVVWGSSFLATKVAIQDISPLYVSAMRITLAALIVLAVSFVLGYGLPDTKSENGRRIWLHAFGFGLFTNALPFALLSWAQLHVTSAFAGVTMALVPLVVLPLAHFLVPGERMGPRRVIGFLIGFAGALVLIGPQNLAFSGGGDLSVIAGLACFAATACYAIGSVITRLSPPGPQIAFTAAGLTIASVIAVVIAFVAEGPPQMPDADSLAAVVYLGLLPTGLASFILVFVIRRAGPTFLSLVNYQVPVWAVIFGVLILGESLPSSFFGALALILIGLGISQLRLLRRG